MVEGTVLEDPKKRETAQRMLAQSIASGMTSENGATAARIVGVDGNDDQEQSNKRQHLEENNVMDVQLRPELVIHMPAQETANGDHTPSGLNVTNHVMEDPKTGLEFCSKLLSTEEWTVLDKLLSSETATYMDVQLIASGVHGLNGTCVPEAVEEECKDEPDRYLSRREMEERDASETQLK